jgi:uncharacterized coiled-coil protein SlyX
MTMGDREGLIARIRQVRRHDSARDRPIGDPSGPDPERVQALEARVLHLERLVEGLQDSVYRESERHDKLIAELHALVEPAAMGAALAKDARTRGL